MDFVPTTQQTRILFTDKLFGCHVCGDEIFDESWKLLDEDRRFYYDCLHAAQSRQVEVALDKFTAFSAKMYAPGHGPVVRYSLSRLTHDYRTWSQQQKETRLDSGADLCVGLWEYGNLAQAIAKGITKAGAGVESINCEFTEPAEIEAAVKNAMALSSVLPH
jgi:flavorubredoxin